MREGCDSLGEVFDPHRTASGYNAYHYTDAVVGELGSVGDGRVEVVADVDLSGNQSIIGRSMVVTDARYGRIGCCTIGLSAGPYARQSYNSGYGYAPAQHGYSGSYGGYY